MSEHLSLSNEFLALYKKLTTNRKFRLFFVAKCVIILSHFAPLQTLAFANKTHFELACDDDLLKFKSPELNFTFL